MYVINFWTPRRGKCTESEDYSLRVVYDADGKAERSRILCQVKVVSAIRGYESFVPAILLPSYGLTESRSRLLDLHHHEDRILAFQPP
jgi:hypothetical protein